MPVTLCFIKDKHKVMEHKIPLETYFAGLLQKVEWQIQEYEDTAADTLTLCRLCCAWTTCKRYWANSKTL